MQGGLLSAIVGWPTAPDKMAAEPLPREPLSGTCNASGTLTLKYRAPAQFYVHVYIAIQVSAGAPQYAVNLGSSSPLIFGQGTQTQLGPILLQPGEVASLVVTGTAALATVVAQVLGWQARSPTDLVPLLPLQPTAVLLSAAAGPVKGIAEFPSSAATSNAAPLAGYTVASQTQPQHLNGSGNSDVVALGATSMTVVLPANNGVWIIRKVEISSSVAVANKIRLIDGATGFHTAILPANSPPYVYEWPGEGYRTQFGNSSFSFYTDNAGTFAGEFEMIFGL